MAVPAGRSHMTRVTRTDSDNENLPVDLDKLAHDEAIVERGLMDKIRATLGKVPFVEDAFAAYYCAVDAKTPLYVKAVLMGAVAYFVIPADVIPDFIAGLGFTDDAAVLVAAIKAIGGNLRAEHRERAREALGKRETGTEPPDKET